MCQSLAALWAMILSYILLSQHRVSAENGSAKEGELRPPNVILIITDDQGYGDFSCHGNPYLKTPHLDALHADSVRLSDFHVDPMCAPTRAALMTGRYSARTGVWSTLNGCYIPRHDEVTMGHMFGRAGYATAMFGKWHLGDSYPYGAEHRGFQHVVRHGGGVVGEVPDYWNNDYFNDTYWKNGQWLPMKGYCTDIWFDEAMSYMKEKKQEPFFCYLATNAPHGPMNVEDRYALPYFEQGIEERRAKFYGMIANIDENVGRLREFLQQEGLAENTILIYMGDNGTAAGVTLDKQGHAKEVSIENGYNAGMRGTKKWTFEGGHRHACFLHWPAKGLVGGRDIGGLSAHFDLFPTLAEFCDIEVDSERLDGQSLAKALSSGEGATDSKGQGLSERTLVVHNMQKMIPVKYKDFAVMRGDMRLVQMEKIHGGKAQLYDLSKDLSQTQDISAQHPKLVEDLRAHYEAWWQEMEPSFQKVSHHYVGRELGEETPLNCHAWRTSSSRRFFSQMHVRLGVEADDAYFPVQIQQSGRYQIELRRWPREAQAGINQTLPALEPPFCTPLPEGVSLHAVAAELELQGQSKTRELKEGEQAVIFEMDLKAGQAQLRANFLRAEKKRTGAYYVYVKRVS